MSLDDDQELIRAAAQTRTSATGNPIAKAAIAFEYAFDRYLAKSDDYRGRALRAAIDNLNAAIEEQP